MRIIQLHQSVSLQLEVRGAFTFFNATDLIYDLETVLEHVEVLQPFEKLNVSFRLSSLDSHCKRLLFIYMRQINMEAGRHPDSDVLALWFYNWFDEDLLELGQMLAEQSHIKFNYVQVGEVIQV